MLRARALTFVAPRQVRLEEVDVPDPGPGDALVETCWSGISSGTELLAYRGQLEAGLALDERLGALAGTFDYPFRYGYSCVGRVVRSPGEPTPGALVLAYHPHQDRLVVPAGQLVPLGDADARLATLLPLLEAALQVSLDAGAVQHEPVAVVGLGALGTLTAALLRRAGALVTGSDPCPRRRQAAATFGVASLEPERLADWVAERTDGRGVPLVVEASGNPRALSDALGLLAHEGLALVASWYGTRPVTLPLGSGFHRRRLTIRSTQVSTVPARLQGRWTPGRRRALAAALLGELPLSALATHAFPLTEAASAYAALDDGEPGLIHAALDHRRPDV